MLSTLHPTTATAKRHEHWNLIANLTTLGKLKRNQSDKRLLTMSFMCKAHKQQENFFYPVQIDKKLLGFHYGAGSAPIPMKARCRKQVTIFSLFFLNFSFCFFLRSRSIRKTRRELPLAAEKGRRRPMGKSYDPRLKYAMSITRLLVDDLQYCQLTEA